MGKEKISGPQLVMMLLLCRSFNLLSSSTLNVTGQYGAAHLAAVPVSLILQGILVLPALLLLRRSGRDLTEGAFLTLGKAGVLYPVLCCIYLLFAAGITIYHLAAFLTDAIYPGSRTGFFIVTLVIAGCCGAWMGLEGTARSAVILFWLFGIAMLLTFFGTGSRVDPLNIVPMTGESGAEVIKGGWLMGVRSSTALVFLLLCPRAGGKTEKLFLWYLGAVGIVTEITVFFVASVLGELAVQEAYPFFMLTTVAQLSIFQRMDALHVGVWTAVCFLRTTVFLWTMREQLMACLPKRVRCGGQMRWVLPFLGILAAVLAGIMGESRKAGDIFLKVLSSGVPFALLTGIFPLICLCVGTVRKKFPGKGGSI